MYNFFDGTFRKPDGKAAFTSLTRVLIRFWAASMARAEQNIQPNHYTQLLLRDYSLQKARSSRK